MSTNFCSVEEKEGPRNAEGLSRISASGCPKAQVKVPFFPPGEKQSYPTIPLLSCPPPNQRHPLLGGKWFSFYNALLIIAERFCRGIIMQKDLQNKL